MTRSELSIAESDNTKTREVERQLKTLELEIRSLCHREIRQHPNVVQLTEWAYDYSNDDYQYQLPVLILEKADCSLSKALHDQKLSTSTKFQLCFDMASGLQCLTECGIVHGDLKPDNVLLFKQDASRTQEAGADRPWIAKLADFGLSITLEGGAMLPFSRYRSTPGWQPPETIGQRREEIVEPQLLHKCDSYAFGLLALSTLVLQGGSPLYDGTTTQETPDSEGLDHKMQNSKDLSSAEKKQMSTWMRTIRWRLLEPEPAARLSVTPELFMDNSRVFLNWRANNILAKAKAAAETRTSYRRHSFAYWSFMDPSLLRRLNQDLDSDLAQGIKPDSGLLTGLAIASSVKFPPDRRRSLKYFTEAAYARPPSKVAQGLLPNITRALQEDLTHDDGAVPGDFLTAACEDGYWNSARELSEKNPSCFARASQKHRDNGGYNVERLVEAQPQPEQGRLEGEVSVVDVTLRSIQQADLAYFSDMPRDQLAQDVIDTRGNTILHLAAMLGRVDVIRLIAASGLAHIHKLNTSGETPLYKACAAGHAPAIKELLHFAADPTVTTNPDTDSAISCLHWLFQLEAEHMDEVTSLLIKSGADVNARAACILQHGTRKPIPYDQFPFHWPHGTGPSMLGLSRRAAYCSTMAQESTEKTPMLTREYIRVHTPLGLAMVRADSRMVNLLLERGADFNKRDSSGLTALHMLTTEKDARNMSIPKRLRRWCYRGSWDQSLSEVRACVQAFKDHGGNLDTRRNAPVDFSPLLDAADSADSAAVIALLEAGANPQLTCARGLPLHLWASTHPDQVPHSGSYWEALDALLSHTEDCKVRASLTGDTVYHAALQNPASSGDTEPVMRVIRTISDRLQSELAIDSRNLRGETPLLWAARIRSVQGRAARELTEFLVNMGDLPSAACDDDNEDFIYAVVENMATGDELCLEMIQNHLSRLGLAEDDEEGRRAALNASKTTRTGTTALMHMVWKGLLSCVRYVLHLQVDLNAENTSGMTALDSALEMADRTRSFLLEQWMNNNVEPPDMDAIDAQSFIFSDHFVEKDQGELPSHMSRAL